MVVIEVSKHKDNVSLEFKRWLRIYEVLRRTIEKFICTAFLLDTGRLPFSGSLFSCLSKKKNYYFSLAQRINPK